MTTTDERTLFTAWEEDTDIEIQDFPGLRDDHRVCNCGGCGRLLLARRHSHERHGGLYDVADADSLPPICFRKVVVRRGDVVRAVPLCRDCDEVGAMPAGA